MGRNHSDSPSVKSMIIQNLKHKNYLHKLFYHISTQDMIEHSLKKLIGDDSKFQFVTMPN